MRYWVNEDRITNTAIVHEETCGHCNYGQGRGHVRIPGDSEWRGPYDSSDAAFHAARATGRRERRWCEHCRRRITTQVTTWSPIEPLDESALDVDFTEVDDLQKQWLEVKTSVENSNPRAYDEFNRELYRSWAIETGIIEGLYELDRGITQTLVRHGFSAEHVGRNSTNKSPDELVTILRDHEKTIDLVSQWIEESRPLGKTFVRSIHQVIAKNQATYDAVDQFGCKVSRELHKGEFKKLPNNPTRPDGIVHKYCPPEQVESELDNLIQWYETYDDGRQHPLAVAAWLHHRFSQIHPFVDGNGRVVRALLTWHLVRCGYLPIVIDRDTRHEYIPSLEQADSGDISHLVGLIVRLEIQTLQEALRVEPGRVPEAVDTVGEIIGFIGDGLQRKRQRQEDDFQAVQQTAIRLRDHAISVLKRQTDQIAQQLGEAGGVKLDSSIFLGGPDKGNEYYYRREVIEAAQDAGHWVNLDEPRYFLKVALKTAVGQSSQSRTVWTDFVISLHSIGRQGTGVMAAASFMKHRYSSSHSEQDDDVDETNDPEFEICNPNSFVFTVQSRTNLESRFERWVMNGFSAALRRWGERLIDQA